MLQSFGYDAAGNVTARFVYGRGRNVPDYLEKHPRPKVMAAAAAAGGRRRTPAAPGCP